MKRAKRRVKLAEGGVAIVQHPRGVLIDGDALLDAHDRGAGGIDRRPHPGADAREQGRAVGGAFFRFDDFGVVAEQRVQFFGGPQIEGAFRSVRAVASVTLAASTLTAASSPSSKRIFWMSR